MHAKSAIRLAAVQDDALIGANQALGQGIRSSKQDQQDAVLIR